MRLAIKTTDAGKVAVALLGVGDGVTGAGGGTNGQAVACAKQCVPSGHVTPS